MRPKKSAFWGAVPRWLWLLISMSVAAVLWVILSRTAGSVFAAPRVTLERFVSKTRDGTLPAHVGASLFRVLTGFGLAFLCSIPIAFLMAWYDPFLYIVEPWIQFVRNIPPLAYIYMVIVAAGVGEVSKVVVIFIASFLVMVVTMYQGVRNVDLTLIKAAQVLGARQRDIFVKVVIPASAPFILVAARLGLSTSLTTLIAAELTGASKGLGTMIQRSSGQYDMGTMLMGIIVVGIIGLVLEKIVRFLENRLTGWQEKMP